MTKVRKVAKVKPKMTVHDIGPQKTTLSPPKKICGSFSVNRVKKLMFIPVANGISPSTVVIAVKSTGRKRVLPDCTMVSIRLWHGKLSFFGKAELVALARG